MANNPSAQKRVKQSEKRRARNRSCKSSINTAVKKTLAQIEEKSTDATLTCKQAISKLDSAVNKGVLHRNTASRKISKIAKKLNEASAQ
jgi:small subunit ribosomal protein S20